MSSTSHHQQQQQQQTCDVPPSCHDTTATTPVATTTTTTLSLLGRVMRECRAVDKTHTHVMLGSPFGTYYVSSNRMKDFWTAYYESVGRGDVIYLAEAPSNEIPVLVDVDLKAPYSADVTALYCDDDVREIVATYQRVIRSIVVDLRDDALTCVLLEKRPYEQTVNGTRFTKNGFHLHFPKLFVDRRVQEVYIIPLVKSALSGMFAKVGVVTDDFIDDNSVRAHWLMYGSKKPNNEPYVATRCFLKDCIETTLESALSDYVLPPIDSSSGSGTDDVRVLGVVGALPRILSISLHGRADAYYYRSKPSVDTPIIDKYAKRKTTRRQYEQASVSNQLEDAARLIDMMSARRSDEYTYWMEVGWSLWNISGGDADGVMLWLAFSERSPKYNEAECVSVWNRMDVTNYTIGTLKYFAKEDNPEAYEAMMSEKSVRIADQTVPGGHNDLAKVMHHAYGNEFVNANADDKSWYQFGGKNKHTWNRVARGLSLRERISSSTGAIQTIFVKRLDELERERREVERRCEQEDEVARDFEQRKRFREMYDDDTDDGAAPSSKRFRQGGNDTTGDGAASKRKGRKRGRDSESDKSIVGGGGSKKKKRKTHVDIQIDRVKGVLERCANSSFKSSVMTECVEVFRNESFSSFINTDPYLVAFTNGVYDFRHDIFRAGKPEDYLSKSLTINYIDFGSIHDPRVMEVDDFFRRVFPDPEVREFFLDRAAQVFVGGNREKLILFWTGSGDNGKTVTQKLFEKMLGCLAAKVSSSLITGKKSSLGTAAPELARMGDGVRWVVMDEPNKDEIINAGDAKWLSGNDTYWARDLYEPGKETREITPMFKVIMICNALPGIRDADQAMWNRVCVIPFESKFLPASKCPPTYEEQFAAKRFPENRNFSDSMQQMLEPLVWYLIARWRSSRNDPRPRDSCIDLPEKVSAANASYKTENDQYQQFAEACVVEREDARLHFKDVCVAFRAWFATECPGHAMPIQRRVRAHFASMWGELVENRYWDGMALMSSSSSDDARRFKDGGGGAAVTNGVRSVNPMLAMM